MEKVVTKQIREGHYYTYSIVAVATRADDKLRCPTLTLFESAETNYPADLVKLTALLDRIAEQGPPRNEEKFKHLTDSAEIYEIKAGCLRLYCFWDNQKLIVTTNGSIKKSKKADPAAIEAAEEWKKRYFTAKKANQLYHEPEND